MMGGASLVLYHVLKSWGKKKKKKGLICCGGIGTEPSVHTPLYSNQH